VAWLGYVTCLNLGGTNHISGTVEAKVQNLGRGRLCKVLVYRRQITPKRSVVIGHVTHFKFWGQLSLERLKLDSPYYEHGYAISSPSRRMTNHH